MLKAQLLKENERKAVGELKNELTKRFNLVELLLFGSKARGEDKLDSDIDIMIELTETSPDIESQIYDIIYDINLKNNTFISVIFFNKDEIEKGPMSESPIYKIIQKEGIFI